MCSPLHKLRRIARSCKVLPKISARSLRSGFAKLDWNIYICRRVIVTMSWPLPPQVHFHNKCIISDKLFRIQTQNFVIRLKTGLHQATLTLAEPLQGPQVDMLTCFEISLKNMNSLRNRSFQKLNCFNITLIETTWEKEMNPCFQTEALFNLVWD